MTDETQTASPLRGSESRLTRTHTSPSTTTKTPDDKPSSTRTSSRRKAPTMSPPNMAPGAPEQQERQRKQKSIPYRAQSAPSRGTVMTMPNLLGAAGEITYTPTTHRISKAKKGKKVHACEYPGCPKIFTRAEHRKRHEVNHNTSPAFQCQIEGCKKPFQRADLLTRHMERQHNMPGDMSTIRSQHNSKGSMSETAASPFRSSISASQLQPSSASGLPQPSGAMSIGSIIEHDIHGEYKSHSVPNLLDISQQPIGTAPRSLRPELLYGVSPSGDSPLYSSSDSCYSPISDYLQPPSQTVHPGFYSPDLIQRPHSATAIECYQPMLNSPLSVGPPTPAWSTYDPSALGYAPEAPCVPSHRQYQYASPAWSSSANSVPTYEMTMPPQQWPWTKVNF